MSWSEIKKSVNGLMSIPLDKQLGGIQIYDGTSLTGTFKVPEGVTRIYACLYGGGGAGMRGYQNNLNDYSGGGGGGSGYMTKGFLQVTPAEVLSISLGAGGVSNQDGGTSYIKRSTTILMSADGGKTGIYNSNIKINLGGRGHAGGNAGERYYPSSSSTSSLSYIPGGVGSNAGLCGASEYYPKGNTKGYGGKGGDGLGSGGAGGTPGYSGTPGGKGGAGAGGGGGGPRTDLNGNNGAGGAGGNGAAIIGWGLLGEAAVMLIARTG